MVENLIFKDVRLDSGDYARVVDLRNRVLREPLGRTLTPEELQSDAGDVIIAASQHDKIVACCLLKKITSEIWKMRQVAVDFEFHGRGVGRFIVIESERRAQELGAGEMVLNARETAVPFYLKLGYEIVSDEFKEIDLPHFKMRKLIEVEVR